MIDRLVRKISPDLTAHTDDAPRPFSTYLNHPNIILLGDPGAGKSHLFRHFARVAAGTFVTARNFLNVPNFDQTSLFIDALDEKRSGRNDQDTIDAIVRKLFQVSPTQVRISCRERDWHGGSDLAAFDPYFETRGGAVVLLLEQLSEAEQIDILKTQDVPFPEDFLLEANRRGLKEFLTNPQNLIMLYRAVKSGNWPETRHALFQVSTELLLQEENQERSRAGDGVYTPHELLDAAGVICAMRLISDVEGISLREQGNGPDLPSYRTINIEDPGRLRAALGRRAFMAGRVSDTVEYTHRTVAEFLGALWLAKRIRNGLPVGRVRALLGTDGCPASELRGLHAWLAVFLPEYAKVLISADPYGILSYGDAASLSPSARTFLLEALTSLSEEDPWFRTNERSTHSLLALSGADMTETFRSILQSETANFGLKSLVLDALAGAPIPDLETDLSSIMLDVDAPYGLRSRALNALKNLGETQRSSLQIAFHDRLGSKAPDLRLKAEILFHLYSECFSPQDITSFISNLRDSQEEVSGLSLWSLADRLPLSDAPPVLDGLGVLERQEVDRLNWKNAFEIAYFIDQLLVRLLSKQVNSLTGVQLWQWLSTRWSIRDSYSGGASDEIKAELSKHPKLVSEIATVGLRLLCVGDERWGCLHRIRQVTFGLIDDDSLLEIVMREFFDVFDDLPRQEFLYELAMRLSFRETQRCRTAFEDLYNFAETHSQFQRVRQEAISLEIDHWARREAGRRLQEEEKTRKDRARNQDEFKKNADAIRRGEHLGWLRWLAMVYFANFSDLDRKKSPYNRLIETVGSDNVETAIDALIASLDIAEVPSLDTVANLSAQNRYHEWWLAILAGFDEAWQRAPQLARFPDELVKVALAIDLVHPTRSFKEDEDDHIPRPWKDAIFAERPDLGRDAYSALVRANLKEGNSSITGLYELLNLEALSPYRALEAMQLLREYPDISYHNLERLLRLVLRDQHGQEQLRSLARDRIRTLLSPSLGTRSLWLAAGYLTSPDEFESDVEAATDDSPTLVWGFRDLIVNSDNDEAGALPLTVPQMERIVRVTTEHFVNAYPPASGWAGDKNSWDGAEFARSIINRIAAEVSEHATLALLRLSQNERSLSYQDHIRHALAGQRARRRDAEYRQPNWGETLATLSNGQPANVNDLHALVVAHLSDLKELFRAGNSDSYNLFWNEDAYGRPTTPKSEESCRDALVELLRSKLHPMAVNVEPEGHMARDKRADIVVLRPGQRLVMELKRDYHKDLWEAAVTQLDRLYARDPEAAGFGIYVVFWFGAKRPRTIPRSPDSPLRPATHQELEQQLQARIPKAKQSKLAVVVLDVAGD